MRLGLCSRSKDIIEPLLKPQWWVDCKQMAADGCQAVRDGRIEIIPKEFESTWFRWLEVTTHPMVPMASRVTRTATTRMVVIIVGGMFVKFRRKKER
jgi:hypothetical protein